MRGNRGGGALPPPSHIQHQGEQGAQWTHDQLGRHHQDFLQHLPLLDQHGRILLVHASAHHPERWPYVENSVMAERSMAAASDLDPGIRQVFSGHVHQQALYYRPPTAKLLRLVPQPGPAPHQTRPRTRAGAGTGPLGCAQARIPFSIKNSAPNRRNGK